ncbi:ABC transporter ATP-binding protein [Promethearchaeum syntrophicum]|uniref:ABC transporter ATP-binding protein n=1 Tax=Promethearchaeum syntrophicum TaxID=2594042 RepID=A0A5B9DB98_9ARCH|nr:ABC transporter ATP-binding protein [Candidatus Prometheoarchaeum syntrophicum]QEE16281.1 Molybdate/tungstate import ATP-binding protein WtpC [Candidatus Prometheoarchaeum syntrophicum]
MGIFRSIMADKKQREYTDRELFKRYIYHLKPFKKNIFLIALFIIIQAIADLINPLLVGFISDEFLLENPRYNLILIAGLSYLGFYLLNWVSFSLQRVQLGKYIPHFLENLRLALFQKVQEQDMTFFDEHMSGKVNSIIVNDTLDFSNTAVLISNMLGNVVISIFTFVILISYNFRLALITMAGIPVLFLLMFSLRKLAKKVSVAYRKSIGNVSSAMVEAIEGIQISKSFGQEHNISQQFEDINQEYFRSWMRLTAVTHFWRPLINTITSIILCLVFYFGVNSILNDQLSVGALVMFVLYLQNLFRPIMFLGRFFPELSAGMASYERILGILDAKPRVTQQKNPIPLKQLKGKISLQNIRFAYNDEHIVFDDLNLDIAAGEKLAIVGHTGAGKTSLVALLARYYEFQGGQIQFDGKNIRSFTLDSFRKFMGKVEQDVYLFPGTIADNIRYGRQDASDEGILRVIKIVQAQDFINNLPDGINTHIGERGKNLSVGQRQLISFARAILLDPKVLILDEATSSVDAYTEAMIQEALEKILENRTSIIIAHRLSTIINSDRIIVMDHGKIVEEGTHETLLNQKGKYATLYTQYFAHQSLEWQELHLS